MDRTGPGQEDMDRQNGSRPHGPPKKKDPDRVTLKKEIGLLSACTIIIGEEGPGPGPGLKPTLCRSTEIKKKKTRCCDKTDGWGDICVSQENGDSMLQRLRG